MPEKATSVAFSGISLFRNCAAFYCIFIGDCGTREGCVELERVCVELEMVCVELEALALLSLAHIISISIVIRHIIRAL